MGSWCATDGITNLPINYGDKLRVFVLEDKRYHDESYGRGTCYSTDIWSPLGPGIRARYNDYGSVEKIIENDSSDVLLNTLQKGLVENISEEKKEYLETPSSYDNCSLVEIFHLIERGYVKFTGRFGKPVELGLFMVLEEVYQAMISYNPIVAHKINDTQYKYLPSKEALQLDGKKWYNKALDSYQDYKNANNDNEKQIIAMSQLLLNDMDNHIFSSYRDISLSPHRLQLIELAKNNISFVDNKVRNLLSDAIETIIFNSSMTCARKQWSPQTGNGSQYNELDVYKILQKCTDKIIKKRDKEDLKEGGEKANKQGYYSYMLEHNASLEKNNGNQKTVSAKKTK